MTFLPRAVLVPLVLVVSLLALGVSRARADQFVLIDETFTFTKEDADTSTPSKSHYYVRDLDPAHPPDWTSPVDYRNGTVHIRIDVIDKPAGGEVTQWVLCYIPRVGIGQGYGCTGTGTYTEEGVYERNVGMHDWWENGSIDWRSGISEMHLVMKDADDAGGFAHLRPDPEEFFPTTVRITMIQVSAGATYDPSGLPEGPTDSEPDAGVDMPDAGPDDPIVDAGTSSDAGNPPPSTTDAGRPTPRDAGSTFDAGVRDAGSTPPPAGEAFGGMCTVSAGHDVGDGRKGLAALGALLLLAIGRRGRRRLR